MPMYFCFQCSAIPKPPCREIGEDFFLVKVAEDECDGLEQS